MELDKLVSDVEGDVKERGAVGVACHRQALHGCQAAVGVLAELPSTLLQLGNLAGDVHPHVVGDTTYFFDAVCAR